MPTETRLTHLAGRVDELRAGLQGLDPARLAARAGCQYEEAGQATAEFHLPFWDQDTILTYPDFSAFTSVDRQELPVHMQALLLYYFSTCDGTPITGRWISFADLPNGRFYNQAFQGYTGQVLAQTFGGDLFAFRWAAESLGGEKASLGDASFAFHVLPRVPLLVVYWCGDEDFPPACQILFDAAVSHQLPTDACAVLGSTLTQKLILTHRG